MITLRDHHRTGVREGRPSAVRGGLVFIISGMLIFAILAAAGPAEADHIPGLGDWVLRIPMAGEGYLKYVPDDRADAGGRFGDEWTGSLEVRHPSLVGARDRWSGYDRSDRQLHILTNGLTDNAGNVATLSRARDFNYANKAYMLQAGVAPIEAAYFPVTSPAAGHVDTFSFPLSHGLGTQAGHPDEEQRIMARFNLPAPIIQTYYAGHNPGPPPGDSLVSGAFAEAFNPSLIGGVGHNEGIFMGDRPVPRNDTFSHELYHFMGDGDPVHDPRPGDLAHSNDRRNLIAAGAIRSIPATIEAIGPPMSAVVGGTDQLLSQQAERIFAAHGAADWLPPEYRDRNPVAGDRVDWDFVVDHGRRALDHDGNPATADEEFGLEGSANGADNHQGEDYLTWSIGVTADPNHNTALLRHDHTGMEEFDDPPDYVELHDNKPFRYVDVFSLNVRYSDADVDAGGAPSSRERALDYEIFYKDGAGAMQPMRLRRIFNPGWSTWSRAENFLARWFVPNEAGTTTVYVKSLSSDGHDMTAQIDAVIAARDDLPPGPPTTFNVPTTPPPMPTVTRLEIRDTFTHGATLQGITTLRCTGAFGGTGDTWGDVAVELDSRDSGQGFYPGLDGAMDFYFVPDATFPSVPDEMYLDFELDLAEVDGVTPLVIPGGEFEQVYEFGDPSMALFFPVQLADGRTQQWQAIFDIAPGQDFTFGEAMVWFSPRAERGGGEGDSPHDDGAGLFDMLFGIMRTGPDDDADEPIFTVKYNAVLPDLTTLIWDGTDGADWTSAHWDPGPVEPIPDLAMVVDSGTVAVTTNLTVGPGPAASLIIADAGTVGLSPAGALGVTGVVTVEAGGTLANDGVLYCPQVIVSGGTLTTSSGNVGKAKVEGDLLLTDGGTLAVEAGPTGFDRLHCTGSLTIDPSASLDITLIGPGPAIGATVPLIDADEGLDGIFGRVDGVLHGDNQAFAVTYQANGATVTVARPGDVDLNRTVGFNDFTFLAASYGQSGKSWVDGDVDGSGDVAFADFTYLAANYGTIDTDSAAPPPSAGAVELHVNVVTGEMRLVGNAATLSGYNITSALSSLVPDGDGAAAPFQMYLSNLADDISAASLGAGVLVDGELALDAAYDTAGPMDLAFSYGVFGQGGSVTGNVVVVPEPATLALLALGSLAMIRRRRERKAAPGCNQSTFLTQGR